MASLSHHIRAGNPFSNQAFLFVVHAIKIFQYLIAVDFGKPIPPRIPNNFEEGQKRLFSIRDHIKLPFDQGNIKTMMNQVVPIFPLPDLVFFPRVLLPLHIFETRYREMIIDILKLPENERLIGISNIVKRKLDKKQMRFSQIGTIGRVIHHEELPDGRSNIVLLGQHTAQFQEVKSHKVYRIAKVVDLRDEYWSKSTEESVNEHNQLLYSIRGYAERTKDTLQNVSNIPLDDLINALGFSLKIDYAVKQELLEEPNLNNRLNQLIEIIDGLGYFVDYKPSEDTYLDIN